MIRGYLSSPTALTFAISDLEVLRYLCKTKAKMGVWPEGNTKSSRGADCNAFRQTREGAPPVGLPASVEIFTIEAGANIR
jgi:hypothetical protein